MKISGENLLFCHMDIPKKKMSKQESRSGFPTCAVCFQPLPVTSARCSLSWFDSTCSQGLGSELVINLQHKSRVTDSDQRLPGAGLRRDFRGLWRAEDTFIILIVVASQV